MFVWQAAGLHTSFSNRRTDAEAPILWPLDVKSQLIGKDPEAGKIEGRRTKDEMVGLHH